MEGRNINLKEFTELVNPRELLNIEWPPCRAACPVHADIRAYIDLIARGQYAEALEIIRQVLPFPGVCGRICHHPCEKDCRRNELDEPAAIRDLKRFVAEYNYPEPAKCVPPAKDKEKVAVIGGGPSGLTAALDLVKMGYSPTVFEKQPIAGGMLATAIPRYRLVRDVLEKDIKAILAHGVELKTGVEIGKNITIDELRSQGYKAVIVAVGLSKSRALPIPGVDAKGVHLTLPFLEAFAFGKKPDMGTDVVVIGGGNVAVDVARSALRGGAKRVRMACLENEQEQPAWPWEVHETLEEGIETIYRRGPTRIVTKDDRAVGVEFRKVTQVFDAEKKFNPKYDDADLITLECDTVVFAIGQASDNTFADKSNVQIDQRGRLAYNNNTAQTNAPDVFACGEIVSGPGAAVAAVAGGHRAARAVDQFLRGKPINLEEQMPPTIGRLTPETVQKIPKVERAKMPFLSAEQRKTNFDQFEMGYSEEQVLTEARRCMNCGAGPVVIADKCAACLTCKRVCPFDIPVVHRVAEMHSYLCQACGICAMECPASAIVMAGFDMGGIRKQVEAALTSTNGQKPKLIVFASGYRAPASLWRGEGVERPNGTKEIYIPSLSVLNVTDILYAFEKGADGVLVLSPPNGVERYPGVVERAHKRFSQATGLLIDAGVAKERIRFIDGVAGEAEATTKAISEMVTELKKLS